MTKKKAQQLEKKVDVLTSEVRMLKSLILSWVQNDTDPEGEYKPEFVEAIKKAAQEEPELSFPDTPEEFLQQIREA